MDIRSKLSAEQVYWASFITVLILLPWSIRLCSYALVIMAVAGLLTSGLKVKAQRLRQHTQTRTFILFYALYVAGLLYTEDLAEGLISLEQKLALLVVPFIVATSASLNVRQQNLMMIGFVCSNALLTITCLIINTYLVVLGELPAQINFDIHTLANFNAFHPEASPAWLQFSYIGFTNSIISPVYLSLYLTLCILFLLYSSPRTPTQTVLKYLAMTWFSIVILLLASRTGIFVFLIVALINLSHHLLQRDFSIARISIISSAFIAVIIFLIAQFPVTRFRMVDEVSSTPISIPSSPEKWNSVNLRFLEWSAGLEGIKANKIIGTGTGGTSLALQTYYDQVDLGDFEFNYNTHNQYIETYLEIGLAGFAFLLLGFFGPLVTAVKSKNGLLFSLVLMVMLTGLSTCVLERFNGLVFYMAFLSLFMFSEKKSE